MYSFFRLAVLSLGIAALSGCATMTVGSHVETGLDFGGYRTFAWGPADALPTGDPRLDNNPFFQDQVQGAVERRLSGKGLTLASAEKPDLLIHYHANVVQRFDVNRVDRQNGYCYGADCNVDVAEYDAGTLVVDVVDARTSRVIWRGWAQDSVDGVIDDQGRLQRMIDEAVTRMFERFPGRSVS
jgi:hypothetical protein